KDGTPIDIFASAELLEYEDSNKFKLTSIRDLTENKKYRNFLYNSQETIQVGGWEYDAITQALSYSDEMCAILGIEKAVHTTFDHLINTFEAEAANALRYSIQKALTAGDIFDLELELEKMSSYTRWIRITCKPVHIYHKTVKLFGTIQDITESKKRETWLKLIELVVTNTNDAVLITSGGSYMFDQLVTRYINNAFENLTGFNETDIIDQSPAQLFGALTDKKGLNLLQQAIKTKNKCAVELICYKKNGAHFWNEINLFPVIDNDTNTLHWVFMLRNITARKEWEIQTDMMDIVSGVMNKNTYLNESLKELLAFFSNKFQFNYAEAWINHLDESKLNLIKQWQDDDAQTDIFSEHAKSITNDLNRFDNDHWKNNKILYWDVNKPAHQLFFFTPHLLSANLKYGIAIPIIVNEKSTGYFVFYSTHEQNDKSTFIEIFSSLSSKMGIEIKRKIAEEDLRHFFEMTPDVLCIAGTDGYFKKINPAFSNLIGYTESEILSIPIIEFIHPDDRNATNIVLDESAAGIKTIYFENRYITKNGVIVWLAWTSVTVLEESVVFAVAKNITKRKNAENKLGELNLTLEDKAKQLEISNKELEQFAYVASHDLQEPLRMVSSFLTLLENKYANQLDETGKNFIHIAVDGALRMRQIILDLLEYSRVGKTETETETETIDLNLLLQVINNLYQKIIEEKKAVISFGHLPKIIGTKALIQQLFYNLIGNALKYNQKDIPPEIELSFSENNLFWKFSIQDNGVGIQSQYFDKIFIIFQRLHSHEEQQGNGIGLALCKKIVEQHRGKIWLESTPQKGSTFHFTIAKPEIE
ncbi:MAG: PAS domain S-box protein, partial [Ferruginibacter sp.]